MTKMCCVCNKVKHMDSWHDTHITGDREKVSHGYCPHCFDEVMMELHHFMSGKQLGATNQQQVIR